AGQGRERRLVREPPGGRAPRHRARRARREQAGGDLSADRPHPHGGRRVVPAHLQRSQPRRLEPKGEGLREPARGVVPALDAVGGGVTTATGRSVCIGQYRRTSRTGSSATSGGAGSAGARSTPSDGTPGLRADIFRPQGRVGSNESCHQLLAPRVLKHFHRYPTAAKQVFLAAKRLIFANHHTRNAVKENRTAAHRTWRERGVNGAVAIDAARLTTGILERVHLAVQNDTAL